jgi:hypothetical protein
MAMFVAGGVFLSACGGAALSNRDVSEVNADIRAAEVSEATDNPKAALHLKLAKDELAEAQRLSKDGDEDKARLTLDRARADAELAIALTKEAQAQQEAQEALDKINRLSQN